MKEIREAEARLAISRYFDSEWYLSQYVDVARDNIDPIIHYIRYGAAEGRQPCADFDSVGYLVANPDVAAAGMNPFVHWIVHGRKEGRPRGGDQKGRGFLRDINEILPECLKSADWIEGERGLEAVRDSILGKITADSSVYGLDIKPVNFPIVLYSADLTEVSMERIRQALLFTNSDIYVLDCVQNELPLQDKRVFPVSADDDSVIKKILYLISTFGAGKVGIWEVSLAPAICAWSLLEDTVDRYSYLTYVGASIVRSSGLLWRSGYCLSQHALGPRARGKYFLDPCQFRLKPSAAIDPLFGLFRADHLAAALQAAMGAHGERTADVLARLSAVGKTRSRSQNDAQGASPWATQGCALVMSDVVPLLNPLVDPATLTSDEMTAQESFVFVDSVPPRPDQDAGSVTATNFLDILLSRRGDVFFFCTTLRTWSDPYALSMAARGVICLSDALISDYNFACDYIQKAINGRLTFILTRVYAGGEYVEITRARFPRARLIFNTVDLHGLRELREARMAGSKSGIFAAYATSARERDIIRRCDATILLSEAEATELAPNLGYANLNVIPLVAEFSPPKNSFSERHGAIFVGSFMHQPNIDAVEYIIDEIWVAIRRRTRLINLTIIGPHFPDKLRSRLPEGVEVAGFVEDLRGALEKVRTTIAPLRYGAGIKGKIATSLSHGVPCVATTLAAEGMGMRDGMDILIADDPEAFADMVVQLHENEELWRRMSRNGYDFAESQFSKRAVASKLNSMLDGIFR